MTTKEQERLAMGIKQVALAVRAAPEASEAAKALAEQVLSETNDALTKKQLNAPREEHHAADAFNRQMDVVLDAANGSRNLDGRFARRAHMAAQLERQRLVVIDTDELAALFADSVALDVARARVDALEQKRAAMPETPFDDGDVSPDTVPPIGNANVND